MYHIKFRARLRIWVEIDLDPGSNPRETTGSDRQEKLEKLSFYILRQVKNIRDI